MNCSMIPDLCGENNVLTAESKSSEARFNRAGASIRIEYSWSTNLVRRMLQVGNSTIIIVNYQVTTTAKSIFKVYCISS